jgi:hypothetical protein
MALILGFVVFVCFSQTIKYVFITEAHSNITLFPDASVGFTPEFDAKQSR